MSKRRKWAAEELEAVRKMYPSTDTTELAKKLGRTERSVYMRAYELGVKKSPAYLAETRDKLLEEAGKKTRFDKGIKPWNTGKKGWQSGGRSKETQFKPGTLNGQAALNHAPIGSERINKDGVLMRKVQEHGKRSEKWRPVHVLLWESVHGPIPDGHIVVFANRVQRDIRPENLELISRAENMRRNSIHRYPKELVGLMKTAGKLRRVINEKQN